MNIKENWIPLKCVNCDKENIKLWRLYQSSNSNFLCVTCTETKTGEKLNLNESDQIGFYVPLMAEHKTEDGKIFINTKRIFGYTICSEDIISWWKSLSL